MRFAGALIATAVTAAVAMAAITGGCGSSESQSGGRSEPATTQTRAAAPRERTVELALRPLKDADGARGAVRLTADGHKRLLMTITVSGAHRRAVVSLWTRADKAHGLYAVYPGTNTQQLRVLARELVGYRWVNVGEQIPRVRRDRQVQIRYRNLLRVPTNELLSELLRQR